MINIEFPWIPPSKKNGKQVRCVKWRPMVCSSKAYLKWHKEMNEVIELWEPLEKCEHIFEYDFYIPLNKDWSHSKRPFDYSNKIESINDFLVDAGYIEDDNYYYLKPRVRDNIFVPYGEWKVILNITK